MEWTILNHLLETDSAWLAGYIDGEGWIGLASQGKRGYPIPRLAISSTNYSILAKLKAMYGGWLVTHADLGPRSKQAWEWRISGPNLIPVLEAVLPHLRMKGEQAELVLQFTKLLLREGQQKGLPESIRQARDEIAARIKILNRRGIPLT